MFRSSPSVLCLELQKVVWARLSRLQYQFYYQSMYSSIESLKDYAKCCNGYNIALHSIFTNHKNYRYRVNTHPSRAMYKSVHLLLTVSASPEADLTCRHNKNNIATSSSWRSERKGRLIGHCYNYRLHRTTAAPLLLGSMAPQMV
jgi:hypothetical protein